jgi:hypothetical protein
MNKFEPEIEPLITYFEPGLTVNSYMMMTAAQPDC